MRPSLDAFVGRVRRAAEVVAAALLGVMFLAFIAQITARYVLGLPSGWAAELSVVAWLYLVLIGSAFWLDDRDEIRFDLVADSLGPRGRRFAAMATAAAAIALYGVALPATWSYVVFMKVESTSYLKIRLDALYAIYLAFSAAIIVRYACILIAAIRGRNPADRDPAQTSSGL